MHRLVVTAAIAGIASPALCQVAGPIANLDQAGRDLVKNWCAIPLQRSERSIPNQHDPSIKDRVVTQKCPSYSAQAYFAQAYSPPAKLPLSLRVSGPLHALPSYAQPGNQIQGVLRALGKPRDRTATTLTYSLSEERPDQDDVTFEYRDGRVQSITWSWAVD